MELYRQPTAQNFVDLVKSVEGFEPKVYQDRGRGTQAPAIGYGDHLKPGESLDMVIDESQGNTRLVNGLIEHTGYARTAVDGKYGEGVFDGLDRRGQYMLAYTSRRMGPEFAEEEFKDGDRIVRGYPKFVDAVVHGDTQAQRAEWGFNKTVDGEKVPLDRENSLIYDLFFKPEITEEASKERPRSASKKPEAKESASPITELMLSDAYRDMSTDERIQALSDVNKDFEFLAQNLPDQANAWMQAQHQNFNISQGVVPADQADPDVLDSLFGGFQSGLAMTLQTAANAIRIAEDMDLLETDLDESWMELSRTIGGSAELQIGSDFEDQMAAVLGMIPGAIAIPGLATLALSASLPAVGVSAGATAALAPMLGFGASGFVGAYHQGLEEATKRGATDFALGAIYPATAHLSRLKRLLIEGSAAYAVDHGEHGKDRAARAVAFGLIGAAPKPAAPFEVMKALGVKDKVAEASAKERAALSEALIQKNANAHSVIAGKQIVHDANGNPITSLVEAQRAFNDIAAGTHPINDVKADHSPVQKGISETVVQDSLNDPRPLKTGEEQLAAKEAKEKSIATDSNPTVKESVDSGVKKIINPRSAAIYSPGLNNLRTEFRATEATRSFAEKLFGPKVLKAGNIISDLARKFDVPSLEMSLKDPLRRSAGGYWNFDRSSKGRKLKLKDPRSVRVFAHEFGHDQSLRENNILFRYTYNDAGANPKLYEEVQRVHDIYKQYWSAKGFDTPDGLAGVVDRGVTTTGSRVIDPPELTIGGIQTIWKEGLIPEDLLHVPELLSMSYARDDLAEGMAEAFQIWLTNNKKFGGEYDFNVGVKHKDADGKEFSLPTPRVEKILEEWLESLPSAQKKAIKQFREDAHKYYAQDLESRVKGKFGPDDNPAGVLSTKLANVRSAMLDDFGGIANFEEKTFGGIQADGIYESFRLLRGKGEAASRIFNDGAPVLKRLANGRFALAYDKSVPSPKQALEPVSNSFKEFDEFWRYATGRQADELSYQYVHKNKILESPSRVLDNVKSREKLFTAEEIDSMLMLGVDKPHFKKAFEDLQKFQHKMHEFMVETGLVSAQDIASWKRTQFLFSFTRDMTTQASKWYERGGPKLQGNAAAVFGERPTRMLRGSTKNLKDPFVSFMETYQRTYGMAVDNLVKRDLLANLMGRFEYSPGRGLRSEYKDASGLGRWGDDIMKELGKDVVNVSQDQVLASVKKLLRETESIKEQFGYDDKLIDDFVESMMEEIKEFGPEKFLFFLGNNNPVGQPGIITAYVAGKPVHYKAADPLLVRSIQAMHRPAQVGVTAALSAARQFKQRWITRGPSFLAATLFRDPAMASIVTRTGGFHFKKAVDGFKSYIFKVKIIILWCNRISLRS